MVTQITLSAAMPILSYGNAFKYATEATNAPPYRHNAAASSLQEQMSFVLPR